MPADQTPQPPSDASRTLALTGILLAIALAWGVGALQGREDERRDQTPASYAQAAKADAERACAGGEPRAVFECVYEKVEASQEQARGEQDLSAQQRAASANLVSAMMAFLTLVVSGIALWFLKGTLDATQATVRETRRIGEAQVRAYLSIVNVFMGLHNGNVPVVTLRLNNAGQSPALDLSAKIILYWMDLKAGNVDRQIVGGSGDLLATIPASVEGHGLLYDMKGEFRPEELEELNSGQTVLFLCANVWLKWRDVFGVEDKLYSGYVGAFPLSEPGYWRLGSGNEALSTFRAERTSRRAQGDDWPDHPPPPDEGKAAD